MNTTLLVLLLGPLPILAQSVETETPTGDVGVDSPVEEPGAVSGEDAEDDRDTDDAGKERNKRERAAVDEVDVVQPEDEPPSGPEPPSVDEPVMRPPVVEFYGSARAVFITDGDEIEIQDNASRFGVFAAKDVKPGGFSLYARAELGINLVDQFDLAFNPKTGNDTDTSLVLRLGYLGYEAPFGSISVGKQWSAYWAVAVFTDRFPYSGGLANGAFHLGTDGGASGTGRADNSGLGRFSVGGFDLRLQTQPSARSVPDVEGATYEWSGGLSAIYEWSSKLSFGVAFHFAAIDGIGPELEEVGIDGDDRSLLAGIMYRQEPVYVAASYSRRENHDVDDLGVFYDAEGIELYARWVFGRYRVFGGANVLEPVDETNAPFEKRVALLGLERSLGDETFRSVAFVQGILDDSTRRDGEKIPDVVLVGVRWSVDL